MTNRVVSAACRHVLQTYGAEMWHRLATGLTAALAYLVLINVLVYPFRPYLGPHGDDGGGVWGQHVPRFLRRASWMPGY